MSPKQTIIFHGTGCTPEMYWYSWLAKQLTLEGYEAHIPQLPNTDEANLSEWLPFALKNFSYNEDTILVGHSAGSPLILSILENISVKVKQVILVAGFLDGYPNIFKSLIIGERSKTIVASLL
jgi:predicted alpha/beta hydrolase family esterase